MLVGHCRLHRYENAAIAIGIVNPSAAWDQGTHGQKPWRDMMVHADGPTAVALQTVFVENWLESSGEILADEAVFLVENRFNYSECVRQYRQ